MKEIRPFLPHELDTHPEKGRIEATVKEAVRQALLRVGRIEPDLQRSHEYSNMLEETE